MTVSKQKIGIGIGLVILFTVLLSLTRSQWKRVYVLSPKNVFNITRIKPSPPGMTAIERLTEQVERISSRRSSDERLSRILYLVQTESCLPKHLNSADGIGDTNICQCDVVVLSYKQQCNEIKPPEHVEYLFNLSASWNVHGMKLVVGGSKEERSKVPILHIHG